MTLAPWTDEDWLAEAKAWALARLAERGLEPTGEIEQPHVYWWSTVLRIPTGDGPFWFKANRPEHDFEPALTELLARVAPDVTVELVAAERGRAWMLMRDAGGTLRQALPGREQLARWEELLPRYAELQLDLAPRRDELLALGVADHRLEALPGQLRAALDDPRAVLLGHAEGLTPDEHRRLTEGLPEFEALCARLAAYGIPETLQHDDLHDGNLMVADGRFVFFDWGDSCVSHPFHTLVVTLRALAWRHELEPGGPEVSRLRDAYLEPWAAVAGREELAAAADLARRTGTVQRALAWHRFVRERPPEEVGDDAESIPYGLKLYLADAAFGRWS